MAERVPAYRDPSLSLSDRVDDLIARMTLEEKVAQLAGTWSTQLVDEHGFSAQRAAEVMPHGSGHVTRIAASTGLTPNGVADLHDDIQRWVLGSTRLGIPVIVHEESTAGFCARDATQFPQAIGLAATWNPDLVGEIGAVIRDQMLAVGARHTLAPVLDVGRDPRWGRVEETYGEDPELAGVLGVAYVRAVQHGGDTTDLRSGVVCTGKHFVGYSVPDAGLNHGPVQLGLRELREVFAEPFAAAIRHAGLASIMNSYSSVDGLACAASPSILTGLLRDELGFAGTVVADYFSVDLIRTHHRVAADKAGAAIAALRAGLDVELPNADCFSQLGHAVERGEIDIGLIDRSVRRVLTQKFALGLFESPFARRDLIPTAFGNPAHAALARRAAAEAVVVCTNDGVLPLRPDLSRIAVIGPAADDIRLTQGDYHYPAHLEILAGGAELLPGTAGPSGSMSPGPYFPPTVTPLAALRSTFPDAEIRHESGCEILGQDRGEIDAAVEAARRSEVAMVFVGGRSGLVPDCTVGEARDTTDLTLTGMQTELVERVAATGVPTVVVVMSGRVHALAREAECANALVIAWPGGEQAGAGLVDVLTGAVDASGRLPVSVPRTSGGVPVHHGHRAGGRSSKFWGDYVDGPAGPLFDFGHGLSYTTFTVTEPSIRAGTTAEVVEIEATVTNTGSRPGVEVLACYVRDDVATVARPDRQLVGFARVPLEPGAAARVRFEVHPSKLAFYNEGMERVCDPGSFTFKLADHDLTTTLSGETVPYDQQSVVETSISVSRVEN
jgi:beta-glucosidase